MNDPVKHTPLHACHVAAGARMVDFAGWDMPVNYGSQIEEHHAVRTDAGMFDVSHMQALDLSGIGATPFLRMLLANDVIKLTSPGKALYSCMLNEHGGVIDDLIVYRISDAEYRIVVNAGTADKDIAWMRQQIAQQGANVTLESRRDLAMIAVQGPNAIERAAKAILEINTSRGVPAAFSAVRLGDLLIARTGYTGEDGLEITVPASRAAAMWDALAHAGVRPCGLGARDTLRLEAGMNLYGQDMDESTTPLESALGWTVSWEPTDRDFIGRAPLEAQRAAGSQRKLVGLLLEDRGVLRAHQRVVTAEGEGEVTSGSFSPTLGRSIGLARVPAATADRVQVDVRGRLLEARVVRPPFVRNGKPRIQLD